VEPPHQRCTGWPAGRLAAFAALAQLKGAKGRLDLVGVMMLGVDLVRIQKRLRGDAEDRLAALTRSRR